MSKSMTPERAIKKRIELIEYLKYCLEINSDCCLLDEDKRMIISALEYQTPKKPLIIKNDKDIKCGSAIWKAGVPIYKCSRCNGFISRSNKFCTDCGQALDWSDEE